MTHIHSQVNDLAYSSLNIAYYDIIIQKIKLEFHFSQLSLKSQKVKIAYLGRKPNILGFFLEFCEFIQTLSFSEVKIYHLSFKNLGSAYLWNFYCSL